jgi:branched-chain amino acid transport system permease protein
MTLARTTPGRRLDRRSRLLGLAVAVLLVMPLSLRGAPYPLHLLVLCLLFAVLASNWDLTLGYAGLFNFAQLAVFALGAYTSAILSITYGLSPWVGIPASALVAVIASLIAFIPAIRLRGLYVSLTTFAFAQLCYWLVLSRSDLTGGAQGRTGIPGYDVSGYDFRDDGGIGYAYVAIALFLASTAFLRWVVRSDIGLSFVALRDNEDYAISRGVSVARQHGLAFALSGIFTGITGAVYAHYIGAVAVDLFGFGYVAFLLSVVWLGGVGTIYGPIVGAVVLTVASEALAGFGPWRFVILSILTVLTLRFLPEGIWGTARRWIDERAARRGPSPGDEPAEEPGVRPSGTDEARSVIEEGGGAEAPSTEPGRALR